MIPSQIQVGALYRLQGSKLLLLGVGKRVMWEGTQENHESNFTDKHLVIIHPDGLNNIGQMLQDPEDCHPEFWKSVEKLT
jgi:hypothetical protein